MGERTRLDVTSSLTHPLFLGGLALLVVNDHVLKGARMLPAVVTGKLSDIAGMLVAPLVLAWLLRVGDRRGWLGCHLAVGLGFALLQVGAVAHGAEELLRGLGVGARVWADPTDLVALPMLLVSARWLYPRPHRPSHRAATLAGVLALVFCTATPNPNGDPPPRYPFPPAGLLRADLYVRHMGSEDLHIVVRRLRDEAEHDCDRLLEEPDVLLRESDDDFTDEQEWTLARGDAVPLWDRQGGAVDHECYAVRLKVRDREWFVTWRHGAPALREVDIRLGRDEQVSDLAVVVSGDGESPPRVPEGVTVRRRP